MMIGGMALIAHLTAQYSIITLRTLLISIAHCSPGIHYLRINLTRIFYNAHPL